MNEYKYQRIFLIVLDSLGFGALKDADLFGDAGANTIEHLAAASGGLSVPHLESLGMGELANIMGVRSDIKHLNSYVMLLNEASRGKDTLTGHWEMMGVKSTVPFKTFTDTGFPEALIKELEKETGHKIIGNIAASGTEILEELGEEQMKENSLIVYTSADSVLQIAAHEEITGVQELYRCCEIARRLCMDEKYLVGRVIARPFIGTNARNFKRTANRHDYALKPPYDTALNLLMKASFMTIGVGKINDIFASSGITKTYKTVSNDDGMDKTIALVSDDFTGLVFTNLVEFDSEWGHRRNPAGYAKGIEAFDTKLKTLIQALRDDDLLLLTADHGNDPTWHGTDHTRERVMLIAFSKQIKTGRRLPDRASFGDIGRTILENFKVETTDKLVGTPIKELLDEAA
ncbi:MAG: phosphopentomutase [Erysipelotrichaceae bacterium]|nr:phosphopentomutase [Erysipelotrichaceae bacterium]